MRRETERLQDVLDAIAAIERYASQGRQTFDRLNISEIDRSYQLTLRQPLLQIATAQSVKQFAVGITGVRKEGDERLLGIPFPISPGADDRRRTRISAVRFFQEWNQRSDQEVFAVRSQFGLGVGAMDATIHRAGTDSRFFSWLGELAWLRKLNKHNLQLLTRADVQLATRRLVPFEQNAAKNVRDDYILSSTQNGTEEQASVNAPYVSGE